MGFVSTIAGTLKYGDEAALEAFYSEHAEAHVNLNAVLAQQFGIALDNPDLSGPADDVWFAQHYTTHQALDKALQVPGFPGLSTAWRDEESFNQWHQVNINAHQQYGLKTGVS